MSRPAPTESGRPRISWRRGQRACGSRGGKQRCRRVRPSIQQLEAEGSVRRGRRVDATRTATISRQFRSAAAFPPHGGNKHSGRTSWLRAQRRGSIVVEHARETWRGAHIMLTLRRNAGCSFVHVAARFRMHHARRQEHFYGNRGFSKR